MANTLFDVFDDELLPDWFVPPSVGIMAANTGGKPVAWFDTNSGYAWAADTGVITTSASGGGTTYVFTLSTTHNYESGNFFYVEHSGLNDTDLDGKWLAFANSSTTYTIDGLVGGYTVGLEGSAFAKYPKYLDSANQLLDALVYSIGESAQHKHILWGRITRGVAFAESGPNLPKGYGCVLTYAEDGSRTLEFVKVKPTGQTESLAIRTVTLNQQNPGDGLTDLGVLQRLRFMIVDEERDNNLTEQSVVLRAYLNEDDLGQPTLEFRDDGIVLDPGTGVAPPWRQPGTWMISFGAAEETFYDTVSFTDAYVVPSFGVYGKKSRTLAELRAAVKRRLTIGGNTGYETELLDDAINDALLEAKSELGDKALFWMKLVPYTMTTDDQNLCYLPEDVDRVIEVYDQTYGNGKVGWSYVVDDERGRCRVEINSHPDGRIYTVKYVASFEPLVNDGDFCPIPREHDEVVVIGAALRIHGEMELNQKAYSVLAQRWRKSMNDLQKIMSRRVQSQHPAMRIHWRRPRSRTMPSPHYTNWYV